MKKSFFIFLISLVFLGSTIYAEEIEEIVVTGTLLKDIETDSSPVDQITNEDFDKLIENGWEHWDQENHKKAVELFLRR